MKNTILDAKDNIVINVKKTFLGTRNSILSITQKTPITRSSDLKNVVNEIKKRGDKNLLLSIINNNNQRRYLGVKLN